MILDKCQRDQLFTACYPNLAAALIRVHEALPHLPPPSVLTRPDDGSLVCTICWGDENGPFVLASSFFADRPARFSGMGHESLSEAEAVARIAEMFPAD